MLTLRDTRSNLSSTINQVAGKDTSQAVMEASPSSTWQEQTNEWRLDYDMTLQALYENRSHRVPEEILNH